MMDEKIINEKFHKYEKMLSKSNISVYEYYPATDTAVKLDASLDVVRKISPYMNEINSERWLDLQEQSRYVQFLRGMSNGNIEIQYADDDGHMTLKSIRKLRMVDETTGEEYLLITKKDVTKQKNTERKYREQAQRDSMTKLYNRVSGKEIVESYLDRKNPYESCGMLVMDVDYFKGVNDSYGHLFGDKVLIKISQLLMEHFDKKAVVSRVGGDEFIVFCYDIENNQLVSRVGGFFDDIKTLTFAENDYIPTCSIGVCFVVTSACGRPASWPSSSARSTRINTSGGRSSKKCWSWLGKEAWRSASRTSIPSIPSRRKCLNPLALSHRTKNAISTNCKKENRL